MTHDDDLNYEMGIKRLFLIAEENKDRTKRQVESKDLICKGSRRHVCNVCGSFWYSKSDSDYKPKSCPKCRSTLWDNDNLYRHTCRYCTHSWVSKIINPKMCPNCKTTLWDRDIKAYKCFECGRMDKYSIERTVSERCPGCGSEEWKIIAITYKCKRCGSLNVLTKDDENVCCVCRRELSISPEFLKTWKKTAIPSGSATDDLHPVSDEEIDAVINAAIFKKGFLTDDDINLTMRCNGSEDVVTIARDSGASLDRVIRIRLALNSISDA